MHPNRTAFVPRAGMPTAGATTASTPTAGPPTAGTPTASPPTAGATAGMPTAGPRGRGIRHQSLIVQICTFVLALLMGRIVLLDAIAPVGMAFYLACHMSGLYPWYPLMGAMAGALLCPVPQWNAVVCCPLHFVLCILWRMWRQKLLRMEKLLLMGLSQILLLPVFFFSPPNGILYGLTTLSGTLFLAILFQSGMRSLLTHSIRPNLSGEQLLCICVLAGLGIASLGDVRLYSFSLAECLLTFTLLFAAHAKGMPAVAAAVAMSAAPVLSGHAEAMLVASCAGCTLAGAVCQRMGRYGVCAGFCLCAVSILSYAGDGQCLSLLSLLGGSAGFVLLPKQTLLHLCSLIDTTAQEQRLEQMSAAFVCAQTAAQVEQTASAVEQVAHLFDPVPMQTQPELQFLFRQAMCTVCGDCKCRPVCWHSEEKALKAMERLLLDYASGAPAPLPAEPLSSDCPRTQQLIAAGLDAQARCREKLYSLKENAGERKLVHTQLKNVSSLMHGLAGRMHQPGRLDESAQYKLCRAFKKEGIAVRSIAVMRQRQRFEVRLGLCGGRQYDPVQLTRLVSHTLRRPMRALRTLSDGRHTMLTLEQAHALDVQWGSATLPMPGSPVSGDSIGQRQFPGGKALFILSDGMGSGADARKQSEQSIALLLDFYQAGMGRDAALSCMNRLLYLQNQKDMYATIDAVHIDLQSGQAEWIKFGAPPGFIVREGSVSTIYAEALPAGIVSEAVPAIQGVKLRRGDVIVLLSDGTLDALGDDVQEIIRGAVEACSGQSCNQIAHHLLCTAKKRAHNDDMSVLVVRVV